MSGIREGAKDTDMAQQEQALTRDRMDRRDMIRRTAILGGALLWATPTVQTMTSRAAAETPVGEDYSNIFVAFYDTRDCVLYGANADDSGVFVGKSSLPGGMGCPDPGDSFQAAGPDQLAQLSGPFPSAEGYRVTVHSPYEMVWGFVSQPGGTCGKGQVTAHAVTLCVDPGSPPTATDCDPPHRNQSFDACEPDDLGGTGEPLEQGSPAHETQGSGSTAEPVDEPTDEPTSEPTREPRDESGAGAKDE